MGLSPSPPLNLLSIQWLTPLTIFYCQTTAKFRGFWGTSHDQSRVICPGIDRGNCSTNIGHCDARGGSSFHRLFDRVNIGFRRSLVLLSLQRQRVISGSLIGLPSSRKKRCSCAILPAARYSARSARWRCRTSIARGQSSTSRSSCVLVRSLSRRRTRLRRCRKRSCWLSSAPSASLGASAAT